MNKLIIITEGCDCGFIITGNSERRIKFALRLHRKVCKKEAVDIDDINKEIKRLATLQRDSATSGSRVVRMVEDTLIIDDRRNGGSYTNS